MLYNQGLHLGLQFLLLGQQNLVLLFEVEVVLLGVVALGAEFRCAWCLG
jgi:hypothetical protein